MRNRSSLRSALIERRYKFLALGIPMLLVIPVRAGMAADAEFSAIVDRLSDQFQKRPMRFMGLIDFIANRATPHGVSHLKMAIFDDVDTSRHPADSELDAFVERAVGGEYHPFVKVRSHHDDEQTFIYVRESGKSFEMLLVTVEPNDAVVLKMRLRPEAMAEWVDEPVRKGREQRRGPAHEE